MSALGVPWGPEQPSTPEPPWDVDQPPFGWSVSIDIGGCKTDALHDPAALLGCLRKVCEAIGMTPHGPGWVDQFGRGHLHGLTAVQPLKESLAVLHAAHAHHPRSAHLDVFSCRPFTLDVVVRVIRDCLGAKAVRVHPMLERRAPEV